MFLSVVALIFYQLFFFFLHEIPITRSRSRANKWERDWNSFDWILGYRPFARGGHS